MKTKSFLLSLILLIGLLGFNSCNKDEDPAPLNKEEAEAAISESSNEYVAIVNEMATTDGYKIQEALSGMNLPFNSSYKVSKTITSSKSNIKNLKETALKLQQVKSIKSDDYIFDFIFDLYFEEYVGTWTWNNGTWDYSSTPSNEIIINFPYPSTNPTNNARITYYDYSYSSMYQMPIGLKYKVELNNVEVFSAVYSASISTSRYSTSIEINFDDFNLLQTQLIEESDNSAEFSFVSTLKKNSTVVYKESASFKITPKENDAHFLISAKVTIKSLEFRIKLEFDYSQLETMQSSDPNQFVEMSLYTTDDAKVGDFIYKLVEQEWELYFVFTNGVELPAEDVMPDLGEDIDSFWSDIFDGIDDLYSK